MEFIDILYFKTFPLPEKRQGQKLKTLIYFTLQRTRKAGQDPTLVWDGLGGAGQQVYFITTYRSSKRGNRLAHFSPRRFA